MGGGALIKARGRGRRDGMGCGKNFINLIKNNQVKCL